MLALPDSNQRSVPAIVMQEMSISRENPKIGDKLLVNAAPKIKKIYRTIIYVHNETSCTTPKVKDEKKFMPNT